jgi:CMP-N-acetylneuraminic acid synthetase
MRTVAVIPVKHESERVKQKNFRPFDGDRSLLDIKIDQLKKAKIFDEIYISSDSPEARKCSVLRETSLYVITLLHGVM